MSNRIPITGFEPTQVSCGRALVVWRHAYPLRPFRDDKRPSAVSAFGIRKACVRQEGSEGAQTGDSLFRF